MLPFAISAHAQPCYRVLDPTFTTWGLSADGRTVLGASGASAALCDRDTGALTILAAPAPGQSRARAISADGRTVVGSVFDSDTLSAVVWRDGVPALLRPPGTFNRYGPYAASADGTVVIGGAIDGMDPNEEVGLVWRDGVPTSPPLFPGSDHCPNFAMTPDGRLMVGGAFRNTKTDWFAIAVTWTDQGSPEELIQPRWHDSMANGVTPDGRVIIGIGNDGSRDIAGTFRWVKGLGARMLPVPEFLPQTEIFAMSVADDGAAVSMVAFGWIPSQALLWTRAAGTRRVLDVLTAFGCIQDPWSPDDSENWCWLSADGRTLAGSTTHGSSNTFSWVATLPPEQVCYANCDSSTTPPALNVNDFICFQQRFLAGDDYANCDESSSPPVLNVNDFVCFLRKFAAGCG